MDNDEEQCNEFLALNSIFTEEFFQVEEVTAENILRTGALLLSVEHANPFFVYSNQSSDVQILVKYLPPIMLRFSLPKDYPSASAPNFTILCPWLNKNQITLLSAELDRLWTENGAGSVILFTWASYLQTSALHVLSLNTAPLQISPDILHHVLEYNAEHIDRMFSKSWITCLVCMCEKSGNASMLFKACDHAFCRECLASYFEMLIRDGNVRRLNCPYDKCETEASPAQVKELVSKEAFERYDRLLLKKAVNAMKDVTCCPRTNCGHPIVRDLGGAGTCQLCQFVFCLSCRREYHHQLPCSSTEGELAMKSLMMNSTSAPNDISWMSKPTSFTFDYSAPGSYLLEKEVVKSNIKTKYGQGEWERLVEDGYSQTFMSKLECRPCPQCDTPIQKNGGCDHMHCINCDCQFCWACLSTLASSKHEHNKKHMEQIKMGVYGNWALYD